MTPEQQKQEERNFLASLGLDDVEIQSDGVSEPPEDEAWLLDTLDAMALLRARGESVSLTLMGGGEEEAALKKQAQTLGLTDCVRFTGGLSREEIAAVCRESDAFALASRRETFGVVYIEAMATGLPVIATRCMGPEDFVNDENGIRVPPEDAAAFADAMERMIRSRDRYDSEAIAAFVRSRFSPQNVAEQLTQVYKEIVKC